ncbi:malonyl-CoA-acyl carrier protein transacylase, mitochondrial-like [Mercenaria mercenaria]|uniref:malonyl-CoA-acyl carrier protein transacylase, mitochondrial-like n=1 Tax=Mercenaria mercenaria TaxID=6596 RepID=UPI00234F9F18|nr:malonyl-CoA-acyl carrier protein transacylase, mitochondrial-like [Mercenaria mercenaria]
MGSHSHPSEYNFIVLIVIGIQMIKLRAKAMQYASETVSSGMLTVFCDHQTKLRSAMVAAREYCRARMDIEEPVCKVANYLCTDVRVVAGHEEALDFLQQYGKEWGICRTKRLPVSGAFHTNLMYGGRPFWKYWDAWDKVTLKEPKYRIHSNLDGKQYRYEEGQDSLKYILRKQMMRPVAWEQLMHILYTRKQGSNFPKTFEVGPGRQLGYLLQKTNSKAFENYKNIEC